MDIEGIAEEGETVAGQRRNIEDLDDDDNHLRAHRRPRVNVGFVMPQPFSTNSVSAVSIRRTTIVDLSMLTHPDAEPSLRRAIVLQILRIIAHNPHVQNGSSAQIYNRPRGYGPVRPSSMPYTRLILCRVFSESEGNLLVYLMESPLKNQNTNLWLHNIELRDNGVISIGTILRIVSPLPVTSYLRGDSPILESHQPAIVLHQPARYLEVLPHENLQGETSRAFVLNSAQLSCNSYSCEKTKCGG